MFVDEPGTRIPPDSANVATSGVAHRYQVIYGFKNIPDAATPFDGLTEVGGTFYGTAYSGGLEVGAVFTVAASGAENVLYDFKRGGTVRSRLPD